MSWDGAGIVREDILGGVRVLLGWTSQGVRDFPGQGLALLEGGVLEQSWVSLGCTSRDRGCNCGGIYHRAQEDITGRVLVLTGGRVWVGSGTFWVDSIKYGHDGSV